MKKYLLPLIAAVLIIKTLYLGIKTSNNKLDAVLQDNCMKSFNGHIVKLVKLKGFIKLTLDTGEEVFFGFLGTGRDSNNDSQEFINTVHNGDMFMKKADKHLIITKDSNSVIKEWLMECD